MHLPLTEIAAMSVGGGICGALISHLTRPRHRRHRGAHRPVWRRAPRTDPYKATDVPLFTDGAVTQTIPVPRDGAGPSQGEQ